MGVGDGIVYLLLGGLKCGAICLFLGLYFREDEKRKILPLLQTGYFLAVSPGHFYQTGGSWSFLVGVLCLFTLLMGGYRGGIRKRLLPLVLDAGVENTASSFLFPVEVWGIFFFILMYFFLKGFLQRVAGIREENEKRGGRREREMRLQLEIYRRRMEAMEDAGEADRILRHDLKHHLRMLSDYVHRGENGKALAYMEKISLRAGSARQYIETGNGGLDSILNYFMEETDRIGASAIMDVKMSQELFMDDFDINVILTNLLANACEAMQKSEKKELEVSMGCARGILTVTITNTYNGVLKKENGEIITTKDTPRGHGVGLASIRKTVEKYDGEMQIRYTPEEFKVKVLLYLPVREEKTDKG